MPEIITLLPEWAEVALLAKTIWVVRTSYSLGSRVS